MTCPVKVWLDGRSKISVLLVKIGLFAMAETSVDFLSCRNKYLCFIINHSDLVLKIFGELGIMDWNWELWLFNHSSEKKILLKYLYYLNLYFLLFSIILLIWLFFYQRKLFLYFCKSLWGFICLNALISNLFLEIAQCTI